jgi:predicted methyltransferase
MGSLVEMAHSRIREVLSPGATAVDCTAGNGHDTAFLCRCVGPHGCVLSIDIQREALTKARALCLEQGLKNATFVQDSHDQLATLMREHMCERPKCVMFNLGFLPGGVRSLTTKRESTQRAIEQAIALTQPGGIISILAYRGHPGGTEEEQAVSELLHGLPKASFRVHRDGAKNERDNTPVLWTVRVV